MPSVLYPEKLSFSSVSGGVSLRTQCAADRDFLTELYVSTRWDEMRAVPGWNDDMRRAFLCDQARMQAAHYARAYPEEAFFILLHDDKPSGRLALAAIAPDDLRIIDIALMPEARGKGLGGRLLQRILTQAQELGMGCSLHVLETNPAIRLYLRLGFIPVRREVPYILMRSQCAGKSAD